MSGMGHEGTAVEFRSVDTEEEALAALAERGAEAHLLAGGTDVMVQYLRGEIDPALLLHIEGIGSLRGVRGNGTVVLGALTTHRRLATDPDIRRRFPALAEAAATVGGWQTQAVGTIAGNVCNASPAADTVPPLLVAGTIVHLASASDRRSLPLGDFLLGRRQTARRPDELVTALELPLPAALSGETYLKVGPRRGMEVALVGLAARLTFGDDRQTVDRARLALCSVAPHPFRAEEAETVLEGSRLEPEGVAEAGRLLVERAQPIDDPRATAAYRRRVLAGLLERAIEICRRRALGE